MAQLQNLVLADRAGTPVNHTFVPLNIDANGVGVVEETSGVPIGSPRYTVQCRKVNGRYKVTLKMSVPVVQTQTINGVSTPVVVRTAYVDCVFTYASTSSVQERKDIVGQFQDSLSATKTLVNDSLINLAGVY